MRRERWAFAATELADPHKCRGNNELVAYIDIDNDWGGVDSVGIVVERNGIGTNRFDDGTKGVPTTLIVMANEVETLLHPDGEETAVWKDVDCDSDGRFIRFSE